jgi:hypothetical protein
MAKAKLKDSEAKKILLQWPGRTRTLWSTPAGSGFWLRAQPNTRGTVKTSPRIRVPGSKLFATQPDAMWVFLHESDFADVVCVEVCGTASNLNDKRSRYSAAVRSLVLQCPLKWLLADTTIQKGRKSPRWEAARSISKKPIGDLTLPLRFARVLYALPKDLYPKWSKNNVPGGHEYFCLHSSLDSYNSQKMQLFLRQLSFAAHFHTKP